MPIRYLKGDATSPVTGNGIIAHIVNNKGGWGAGFVLALSSKWSEPERFYRRWHRTHTDAQDVWFQLGAVQFVNVASKLYVANMLAQHGYSNAAEIPLRYDALEFCLKRLSDKAIELGLPVHMPRIGCALGGGSWNKVEALINKTLPDVDVYVYDFPGSKFNP